MKENNDKEYCLEVWGNLACFTRPEFKVERMSYEIITPSAARNIFQAIFWKPAIDWEITKIEVLNPIQWINILRNEVPVLASSKKKQIFIEQKRTQRNNYILKNVRYRIHAIQRYHSILNRDASAMNRTAGPDENPGKYNQIFERRAKNGQCIHQPYLGIREYAAYFKLVDNDIQTPKPINLTKDLGFMFFDWIWKNKDDQHPGKSFFHAEMLNGIINIPAPGSKDILR